MRTTKSRITLAVVSTLALVGGGTLFLMWNTGPNVSAAAVQPADRDVQHARALSNAFREVAKSLRPSVVSVRSVRTFQPAARKLPDAPEIPREFRRFFDDDNFERFFDRLPRRPFRQRGAGSGVIVSKDGYIVTNNHVVRGADKVTVVLYDKRSFTAEVVGTDAKTDIAVLKIEADNLTPAKFGDSDKMQTGDWVLAIGSPFHLSQTVTAGIVSAKGRGNVGITDYEDFLQTDAAINPGNSGGPLVNLNGEIVGINTAIASRSGGSAGIGFAIPSKMVQHIYTAIVKHGKVERGRIGAGIQDLTPKLAKSFGYKMNGGGVLVGDVLPDGPADKAGLKSGDIVISFNGRKMRNASHLRNTVAATAPGTKVAMKVFRDGKFRTLSVTVGKLDEQKRVAVNNNGGADPAGDETADFGMTLRNVTPALAKRLKLRDGETGAVVTDVESGSIAATLRIRTGDVIVAVGGKPVRNVDDFREAVKDADLSKGLRMQIHSRGLKRYVFLQKS